MSRDKLYAWDRGIPGSTFRALLLLRAEIIAVNRRVQARMEAKIADLNAKVGKLMKENDSLKRELSEMRKDVDIVKLTQPDPSLSSLPGSADMYSRVKSLKSSKRRPHSLHETMVIPPEVQGQLHHSKLNGNISEMPNQPFLGSVPPFYFTVENYSHLKKNALKWFSSPFYSHAQGYKLCIEVDVAGSSVAGQGAHISVLVHLVRGEYDEQLKWPFCGLVKLKLLNELGDHNHFEGIIEYKDDTPLVHSGQVINRERSAGWGIPLFIESSRLVRQSTLDCEYLKYNRLCFVVSNVNLIRILS